MTVRRSAVASSAPSRCSRSVSASAFTSVMARAERVVAGGLARAEREVLLAQGGQQVRDGAQRPHHAALHGEGEAEPEAEHEEVRRPLHLRAVAAEPEEEGGGQRARRARHEREEQDAALVVSRCGRRRGVDACGDHGAGASGPT